MKWPALSAQMRWSQRACASRPRWLNRLRQMRFDARYRARSAGIFDQVLAEITEQADLSLYPGLPRPEQERPEEEPLPVPGPAVH